MTSHGKLIRLLSFLGLVLISCLFIVSTQINKPVHAASTAVTVLITINGADNDTPYGGFNVVLYNPDDDKKGQVLVPAGQYADPAIAVKLYTESTLADEGWEVCKTNIDETRTCGDVVHTTPVRGVGGGYEAKITIDQDVLLAKGTIDATVQIDKELNDESSFGPLEIKLMSGDSIVTIKETDSPDGAPNKSFVNAIARFGVADLTKEYQICLVAYEKCSTPPQTFSGSDKNLELTITLTAEEYQLIITGKASSCSIEGVGWLICPITRFLANVADGAFHYISNNFLEIKSEAFATDSSTYKAWAAMRNIANVLFVIVFMVIVISQMTSVGINNYGVKKMLPRLVVAAILVNVSYFLCQIAVDISNILGYSIDGLLKGVVSNTIGTGEVALEGGFWAVTGGILGAAATGVLFWASLSILIPTIISAVIALLMIFFILVARQAIVILLVVVSPIAFVAYLLPNTNSLFKQWKKMFIAMLVVFPVVALVFGGAGMAAMILNEAFQDTDNENLGKVVVAAINVLPLFLVPGLLKKSLDGVGNIGGMINGIGDKVNGFGQKKYQGSNLGQYMKYRDSKKELDKAKAQSGTYKGHNPYRYVQSRANKAIWSDLKNSGTGSLRDFAMNAETRGNAILDKEFEEQVSMATASQKNLSYDALKNIATGKTMASESERTAAIRVGLQKGAYADRKEIYQSIGKNDSERIKTSMTDGFFAQKDHQFFGAGMAGDIANGAIDDNLLIQNMVKNAGKFSAETLFTDANASKDALRALSLDDKSLGTVFMTYLKDAKGVEIKDINGNKIIDSTTTRKKVTEFKKVKNNIIAIAKNAPNISGIQGKADPEKAAIIEKISKL